MNKGFRKLNIGNTEYSTNIPKDRFVGVTPEQYAEYLQLKDKCKECTEKEKVIDKLINEIINFKQNKGMHDVCNYCY